MKKQLNPYYRSKGELSKALFEIGVYKSLATAQASVTGLLKSGKVKEVILPTYIKEKGKEIELGKQVWYTSPQLGTKVFLK